MTLMLYREILIKDLPRILWTTAEQTVRVMFIIAAAGLFGWLLIHQKVPEAVIDGLTSLSDNPVVILLSSISFFSSWAASWRRFPPCS